jgi:aspartyl-tRNA(Asn)/glutamyl-tRNA(Gln) amidotransferase subunit A
LRESELQALIDNPEARSSVPAREFALAVLSRIESLQPTINAFISLTPELALADAKRVDSARARKRRLPLDGQPIGVKDNIDVAGYPATAGARFLKDNIASQDATVVRRLRAAGAVIVGKTNMHELAFGGTTRNEFYGTCRNPWNLDRIPGGSSGGSGAAVAADMCAGALGTDTGGSVRLPAAINGVTGLRPTYGRVSNSGVLPLSRSLDTVGPLARSAADVAALYRVMAGYDDRDPLSVRGFPFRERRGSRPRLKVGLAEDYLFEGAGDEGAKAVRAVGSALVDLGLEVRAAELPELAESYRVGASIVGVEALSEHEHRLRSEPEQFSDGVRRRLELHWATTATDYARKVAWADSWRRHVQAQFADLDLLLTAVTGPPARIDESETTATTIAMAGATYPFSLARLPAISIPCGFTSAGLPIGAQLVAAPGGESLLLQVAAAYQAATDWHRRRPVIPGARAVAS